MNASLAQSYVVFFTDLKAELTHRQEAPDSPRVGAYVESSVSLL